MKDAFVWTVLSIVRGAKRTSLLRLAVLLCTLVFWLGSCTPSLEQPGETKAEGHRRHRHYLSVNQQTLMADIDRLLLTDKPSGLTEHRILPEISD